MLSFLGRRSVAAIAGMSLALAGLAAVASTATAAVAKEPCGVGTADNKYDSDLQAFQDCTVAIQAGLFLDDRSLLVPPTLSNGIWYTVYGATPASGNFVVPDDNCDDISECVADDQTPAPAACWTSEGGNNCPVGNAIQAALPQYMIAGDPQRIFAYASTRPDPDSPAQWTEGNAVISMDGAPVAAAPFVDGVATFKFTPTVPGLKDVLISAELYSGVSGADAWVDSIESATMVLPWEPGLFEKALSEKKVEVGDTYTLEQVAQAKTALGKRLEWRATQESAEVCAIKTTERGKVIAKFQESGKCSIIWMDPKTDEEGKYTFIAKE